LYINALRVDHEVRGGLVETAPLSEQTAQRGQGLRRCQQRPQPSASSHPTQRGGRPRGQIDDPRRWPQQLDDAGNGNPPAAWGQDHSAARIAHFLRELALEISEIKLASLGEDSGDGLPLASLDLLVEIEERACEATREGASNGRLAGARQADKDDVRRSGRHALGQLRFAANRPATRAT
jgi:hypothetical protein